MNLDARDDGVSPGIFSFADKKDDEVPDAMENEEEDEDDAPVDKEEEVMSGDDEEVNLENKQLAATDADDNDDGVAEGGETESKLSSSTPAAGTNSDTNATTATASNGTAAAAAAAAVDTVVSETTGGQGGEDAVASATGGGGKKEKADPEMQLLTEDVKVLEDEIHKENKEREATNAINSAFMQSARDALAKINEAVTSAIKYRDELCKDRKISPEAASKAVANASDPQTKQKPKKLHEIAVGDHVEEKMKGKWHAGVITEVTETTVSINFDDKDEKKDIPKDYDHIRIKVMEEEEKVADQQVLTSAIALKAAQDAAKIFEVVTSIDNAVDGVEASTSAEKICAPLIDIVSPFTSLPGNSINSIAKRLFLQSHDAYERMQKCVSMAKEAAEAPLKKAREEAELESIRQGKLAAERAALEAEERAKNPKTSKWKRAPDGSCVNFNFTPCLYFFINYQYSLLSLFTS